MPVGAAETERAVAWALRLRADETIAQFALHPVSLEDVYVGLTSTVEEADDAAMVA